MPAFASVRVARETSMMPRIGLARPPGIPVGVIAIAAGAVSLF